jgi:hypothetical protein
MHVLVAVDEIRRLPEPRDEASSCVAISVRALAVEQPQRPRTIISASERTCRRASGESPGSSA